MDLGFVIDSTKSLEKYGYKKEKDFIKQMVADVGLSTSGVHASVLEFGYTTKLGKWNPHLEFVDDITHFNEIVDALEWMKSTTRIDVGLDFAYKHVFQEANGMRVSENCSAVAIVMTDGNNNIKFPLTTETAKKFYDEGIKVIVIAVGNDIDDDELKKLVKSQSDYHRANDIDSATTESFMRGIVNCKKLSGKQ